jgi:choline dehydrogenase-like flavoprotein
MGNNPATSVTDRWGKFHDFDNLYCADGSVMTTAGGYNPTETIEALAWRTAWGIVTGQTSASVAIPDASTLYSV